MNQFVERHNLPTLTQKETDHMNKHLYTKEIEALSKHHPKQKAPHIGEFTSELYQIFKEKKFSALSENRSRENTS